MKIEVEKRHLFIFLGVALLLGAVVFVGAVAKDPNVFHKVDQVDWGDAIQDRVTIQQQGGSTDPLLVLEGDESPGLKVGDSNNPSSEPFLVQTIGDNAYFRITQSFLTSDFVIRDGKVGIGRETPQAKLDVAGDVWVRSRKIKLGDAVSSIELAKVYTKECDVNQPFGGGIRGCYAYCDAGDVILGGGGNDLKDISVSEVRFNSVVDNHGWFCGSLQNTIPPAGTTCYALCLDVN